MKIHKHFISVLLCLTFLVTSLIPTDTVEAASAPSVSAHAYVIMDANSGAILLSKSANKKIYPASTVKLMTALVTLDHCSMDKKVKVTSSMLKKVPYGTSKAGIKAGGTYSVNTLLHMLLLPSGADAAIVLSYASCGSVTSFVKDMNKKAQSLNLEHTSFDNPIGLDIGNNYHKTYTTAKDMANLARFASCNANIRTIISKGSYKVPKTSHSKSYIIRNTNRFLSYMSYNRSLFQIIGGKTGTTRAAGAVLITSAKDKNGHEVICAFFGNRNHNKTYSDINKLLNYTFKQGKANKLAWKKGYWDTRYRKSNTLIMNYYNLGKLSVSERFYPTSTSTQKTLLSLINTIANTNYKSLVSDSTLTIYEFAEIYTKIKNTDDTSNTTLSSQQNSILDDVNETVTTDSEATSQLEKDLQICKSYKNLDVISDDQVHALAILVNDGVLPASLPKQVDYELTKEQAVQLADQLLHVNTR